MNISTTLFLVLIALLCFLIFIKNEIKNWKNLDGIEKSFIINPIALMLIIIVFMILKIFL